MKFIKFSSPKIGNPEINSIKETIKSRWIVRGKNESLLKKKFIKKFKKKYCIFFTSWTTGAYALFKILHELYPKNREIIVPSLSFIASANAPHVAGFDVKLADVDIKTYNMNLQNILSVVTKKTKFILTIDQIGNPCELEKIYKFCKKKKIVLIHDAACSFGSKYKNKEIGHFSDFLIFSFHARKLITCGEGGALLTNNLKVYKKLNLFINHGMTLDSYRRSNSHPLNFEKYKNIGLNFRFNDIQASFLISQFKQHENFIKIRRKISKIYDNFFLKYSGHILIQEELPNAISNRQSYMIIFKKKALRNKFIKFLFDYNIESRKGITSINTEDYYKKKYDTKLANSEFLSKNGVQIPMHANLSLKNVNYILKITKKFLKNEKIIL